MTLEIDIPYNPQERQAEAHACPADEMLYGGAAGGGKTLYLLIEAFAQMAEVPYNYGVIFRRTFPQLQRTVIKESLKWYPQDVCTYKENKKRWEFVNGSILEFAHLQHENDVLNYQGAEFGFVGFEECTQFTEYQYDYITSRVRTSDPDIWPRIRNTANPGGPGHQWIKKRFVDYCAPGEIKVDNEGLTRSFIPATIYDNPILMKNDPRYFKRLMQLPPQMKKMLLEGNWDVFEGQAFAEFDRFKHVIKGFRIPKEWPIYRSLDWGYAAPFAVSWAAVSPMGKVYKIREFYGYDEAMKTGMKIPPSKVAKEIKRIEEAMDIADQIRYSVADPAIWTKQDHENDLSIYDYFAQQGVYFEKANNDRINGKIVVHERLKIDDDGTPGFMIFDTCQHTIRTLPGLVTDENNLEDVDTTGEDHIYDADRYMLQKIIDTTYIYSSTKDNEETSRIYTPETESRTNSNRRATSKMDW